MSIPYTSINTPHFFKFYRKYKPFLNINCPELEFKQKESFIVLGTIYSRLTDEERYLLYTDEDYYIEPNRFVVLILRYRPANYDIFLRPDKSKTLFREILEDVGGLFD